jgi:alpha-glucosidase (family GH31 glycosyl hydrolase)
MEDFGEYTPLDDVSADGATGTRFHNRYPRDYLCGVAAATTDIGGFFATGSFALTDELRDRWIAFVALSSIAARWRRDGSARPRIVELPLHGSSRIHRARL